MSKNSKVSTISIVCPRCKIPSLINPMIVHGEEGDNFQWHCTYCTELFNV